VTDFEDDSLDPPTWVSSGHTNSGHTPADGASPRRQTAPPRRGAPASVTRQAAHPAQPAAPARSTINQARRRPGDGRDKVRQSISRRQAERGHHRRRRRRTIIVLAIVLLPIVLLLTAGGWFLYQLNPPGDPGRRISVNIPEHTGTGRIGDLLEDKGVIGSSTAFQIFTNITRSGPFKPGQYSMREHLGVRDAVDTLRAGPAKPAEAKLALSPGLTVSQFADRAGELPGHTKDGFIAALQSNAVRSKYQPPEVSSLEGLLFPDDYVVKKGETDEQILSRLVTAFDQQADGAGVATGNTSGLNPYQTIVAASLIEREAKLQEDRPLIAAVIRNRLAAGMPLQIDATVCYAKGGCDKGPTKADLEIDSPYNTYKVPGLPPTPISTVSVESLMAAAHPADAPYLFYVLADKNGKHKFATTEEEHNKNVEEARQKGLL
jgi:peptidoglycan lytic transglycosylase G